MESVLVKEGTYIEVKAYFLEETIGNINQKFYISNNKELKNKNKFFIAYFKYPNYKLYFNIMAKATLIDDKSSVIYVNPKMLEKTIIEDLLFAIIDSEGTRVDITKENKEQILDNIDPVIISGLYYEFRKNCNISFRE